MKINKTYKLFKETCRQGYKPSPSTPFSSATPWQRLQSSSNDQATATATGRATAAANERAATTKVATMHMHSPRDTGKALPRRLFDALEGIQ